MGLGEEAKTRAADVGGTYTPVMDPNKYAGMFTNVNPYTGQTINQLNTLLNQYSSPTAPSFQGDLWAQQINNLMSPEKRAGDLSYFTNQVMPSMYKGLASPKAETQDYINDLVQEQLAAAAPQWAGSSSKYSGANLASRNKIAAETARRVGYDVSRDINTQAAGLMGQYLGNMGAMSRAGLGAYGSLYGADTSRYGADASMRNAGLGFAGTLASNLAGLSAPDMIAPDLEYNMTLKELRKKQWREGTLPTISAFGSLGGEIFSAIMGAMGAGKAPTVASDIIPVPEA